MLAELRIWNHHSRFKLRLLRRYLYMSSTIYPDVQYFETHGGEGRILFKDGAVEDGSALIAAKNSKQIKCIIIEGIKRNAGFVDNPSTKAKSICNVNSQFYGSEEWMEVWRKTKKGKSKKIVQICNSIGISFLILFGMH